jgi:hypothetical protein
MIEFQCPTCHRPLECDEAAAGSAGVCPACQAALRVPAVAANLNATCHQSSAPPPASPTPSQLPPSIEDMRVTGSVQARAPSPLSCPRCQQPVDRVPEYAGLQVACPHCGAAFVMPPSEGAPGVQSVAPGPVMPAAPPARGIHRRQRSLAKKKTSFLILLIAGGLMLLLVVVTVLVSSLVNPSRPTEAMARAALDEWWNRHRVGEQARITGFRKLDGQRMEVFGVECYAMQCEYRAQVLRDLVPPLWRPTGKRDEGEPSRLPGVSGDEHHRTGEVVVGKVMIVFAKTENGWTANRTDEDFGVWP